jgi:hypothetical protein
MNKPLMLAALVEIGAGLALVLAPALIAQMLIGAELTGLGIPIARIAGLALLGLGISSWPGPAAAGMLVYSALVALYLAFLGLTDVFAGSLLWPVVLIHVVLGVLLARDLLRKSPGKAA